MVCYLQAELLPSSRLVQSTLVFLHCARNSTLVALQHARSIFRPSSDQIPLYHFTRVFGAGSWVTIPMANLVASSSFELGIIEQDDIRKFRAGLNASFVWSVIPKAYMHSYNAPVGTSFTVSSAKNKRSRIIFRVPFHRQQYTYSFKPVADFTLWNFGEQVVTGNDIGQIQRPSAVVQQMSEFRRKGDKAIGFIKWLAKNRPFVLRRILNYVESHMSGKVKDLVKSRLFKLKGSVTLVLSLQIT